MTVYAKDYNVIAGKECACEINSLLKKMSETDEPKTLVFEKGTYYIDAEKCEKIYSPITNTSAPKEYKDKNEIGMHRFALCFENIKNLTLDGSGCEFVIDGVATNAKISGCENIKLQNFTIKSVAPNMHKLTVTSASLFSAEFELWKESKYKMNGKSGFWYGKNYKLGFLDNNNISWWIASIKPSDKTGIFRTAHPFRMAASVKETSPYHFKARYLIPCKLEKGQTFYVYNAHRHDVGIFIEKSRNVELKGISQTFNYSLAIVAQDCENLNIENCTFAPPKDSEAELASLADFIQVCMCRGNVVIKNNTFDGAADDALNVHGIHFKIDSVSGNKMTVSFRHGQTWGFNPLRAGDNIEYIAPDTMLSVGKNKIVKSELKDKTHIELTLEEAADDKCVGLVIEDVDACPSLNFENNTLIRIITRGILYTSRGKCVIKNNLFVNTTMSNILFSDDAKSWYESGMCLDVTVEGNTFEKCGGIPILILPENRVHKGAVHKNITIKNNVFKGYEGPCIKAKSADGITISGNTFENGNVLEQKDCTNVSIT